MTKKKSKLDLDLNNDGVFDKKDKSIAAKVLATKMGKKGDVLPATKEEPKVEDKKKEVVKEEPKVEGRVCVKDISLTYRAGMTVPETQIDRWKECGINWEVWF